MSSSAPSMSACCMSGSVHEGNPKGREDTIGGLPCYVTEPEGGSTAKSIVFLTDIFGWRFKNVRLLADNYAKAGFFCYIPDVLQNDPVPESALMHIEPPLSVQEDAGLFDKAANTAKTAATLGPWLTTHREAVSKPIIDGFFNTVKMTPGTDKVGAVGFCWGGRYAILAAHGDVDAAVACHPSLLSVPADLEGVTKPLSMAFGDKDSLVSMSDVEKIRDLFNKKTDVKSEVQIYPGQIHGFALRSDWSNDSEKKAMDESEQQAIKWFKQYLA